MMFGRNRRRHGVDVDTSLSPPPGPDCFSVTDLCRRWKIGAEKIRGFLRRGELIGVNVAAHLSGRPQRRVTRESLAMFERRRSTAPPPKPPRRRTRPEWIDFYPGD
jgi:hypothetical protein